MEKERKDNKGRNNINKKDHQLKYTSSSVSESSSNMENKILNKGPEKIK